RVLRELLSLESLGLTDPWLESAEPGPLAGPVRAHQYLGAIDTYAFDPSMDLFGGGGLVSTLEDMGTFFRALFSGGVFRDPDTVSRMVAITPASLSADEGGYGMGIARARYAGIDCVGHGGYWGTLIRYCPEGDLLVTGAATSTRGRDMLDGVVGQSLLLLLGREATSAAGL
ncbi:MAG: serine hydrolase, partial [Gemmatimonadota bacterium]